MRYLLNTITNFYITKSALRNCVKYFLENCEKENTMYIFWSYVHDLDDKERLLTLHRRHATNSCVIKTLYLNCVTSTEEDSS